jgi:hypothetical protein
MAMAEFTFGPFTLDATAARLSRDNAEVRLRPQALQALLVLLRHGGRPIGYDQMIAEAWRGTFVSRHTVDVTVGEVKKVLGEYGRWIVHRPKIGYSPRCRPGRPRKGWHFAAVAPRKAPNVQSNASSRRRPSTRATRAFEGLSTCFDAGDIRDPGTDRGVSAILSRTSAPPSKVR